MKIKFKREQDKFWTTLNLVFAGIFFIAMMVGPLFISDISWFIIFTICWLANFVIGIASLYDAIEWDY